MYGKERKPGYMRRAVTVWLAYNVAAITILFLLYLILGDVLLNWWALVPIIIAVIVTEIVVTTETVGPLIGDWIDQWQDTPGEK